MERIHTFSLKNTFSKLKSGTSPDTATTGKNGDSAESKRKQAEREDGIVIKGDGEEKRLKQSEGVAAVSKKAKDVGSKPQSLGRKSVDSAKSKN